MALLDPDARLVEARSLSTIINLAANPPTYPRNPTQQPLDSLVLYIIRVPGSRDIVLTPLKPPTKVSIAAESIQASLYYLHVATPDDDAHLGNLASDHGSKPDISPPSSDQTTLNNIRRKPVGDHPTEEKLPIPPPHHSPVNQSTYPDDTAVPGRAVSDGPVDHDLPNADDKENLRLETDRRHLRQTQPADPNSVTTYHDSTSDFSVPRRPVEDSIHFRTNQSDLEFAARGGHVVGPPTPAYLESTTDTRFSLDANRAQLSISSTANKSLDTRFSLDANRPQLSLSSTANKSLQSEEFEYGSHRKEHKNWPSKVLAPGGLPNSGIHITLIRRDPAHGLQWNVGALRRSDFDREVIDIDISTPGYAKFAGRNELATMGQLESILQSIKSTKIDDHTSTTTKSHNTGNYPSAGLGAGSQKFNRRLVTVSRATSRRDKNIETAKSNLLQPEPPSVREYKSGYFTFTSPWNGTCTFVASADGHSLKCKHVIPGPSNILATNSQKASHPAVTVAEIRSNMEFPLGHAHHHSNQSTLSPSNRSLFLMPPSLKERAKTSPLGTVLNSVHQKTQRAGSGSGSRTGPESSILSSFHRVHRRSHSRSSSGSGYDEEDPPPPPVHVNNQVENARFKVSSTDEKHLDFPLAREYVGGGLSGKEAKLGKLIINDEGLKMLDLVIAACMGVWWQSYGW